MSSLEPIVSNATISSTDSSSMDLIFDDQNNPNSFHSHAHTHTQQQFPMHPFSYYNHPYYNAYNNNPYCNQYYNESKVDDKLIKSLTLSVYRNRRGNVFYKFRVENLDGELLPEYITHLPGKQKQLSNITNGKIFLDQTFNDFNTKRNNLINKYIENITSLNGDMIEERMVMPKIGNIVNKNNNNNNNKNKNKNKNNNKNNNNHMDTDTPPKKKRKLCYETTNNNNIKTDKSENNNNKTDDSDTINEDWFNYGEKTRINAFTKLRDKILNQININEIKCDTCGNNELLDDNNDDILNGLFCKECNNIKYIETDMIKIKDNKNDIIDTSEEYEVKRISGKIILDGGEEYFLTEWKRYPLSETSWEPLNNVVEGAKDCIAEFNKKIKKNKNTICEHDGYKIVPCWTCNDNRNKGLKDLTHHGIKYECNPLWIKNKK